MIEKQLGVALRAATPPADFGGDLRTWLVAQAQEHELVWLLAHADDGINWGMVQDSKLTVSGDLYPSYAPLLRVETLQQVRLFGERGELYLWQADGVWQGRFLAGSADQTQEILTAEYLLWGDKWGDEDTLAPQSGFVLLADGVEGLRHAPPLPQGQDFDPTKQQLSLQVAHHVAYDEDGQAYVAASRLVKIGVVAKEKGA